LLGLAALLILLGKCVFEAWTGGVCLSFLHLGNVGYPVAVCHAGGMLGGLLLQLLRR
jgi:hypothetical protein